MSQMVNCTTYSMATTRSTENELCKRCNRGHEIPRHAQAFSWGDVRMKMLTAPEWAFRAMSSLVPDETGAIPFEELWQMLQIGPTYTREHLKALRIPVVDGMIKARWVWDEPL